MSRTWTAAQIREVRHLRACGCTHEEIADALGTTKSIIANTCQTHHIIGPRPEFLRDPAPSEAWLLPLLDRYPHDYTDPKARVRRAELDRRQN